MDIAKVSSQAGAVAMNYTVVRLNGQVDKIFMNWVQLHFPDRAKKIRHLIEECHAGKLNDSQFGRRMRGAVEFVEQLKQTMALAHKKYFAHKSYPNYNCDDFLRLPKGQFSLGL